MANNPHGFSVSDLCRRWKVGHDKIAAFIRRGELVAINVASNVCGRPQWRIAPEEVAAFERRRSSKPAQGKQRRPRKPAVRDYFPDDV